MPLGGSKSTIDKGYNRSYCVFAPRLPRGVLRAWIFEDETQSGWDFETTFDGAQNLVYF